MASATVRIGGLMAVIEGWHWEADEPWLADLLNGMLDEDGPSGDDPQPEINAAEAAVAELGGEVVSAVPGKTKPGEIY